MLTKREIPPLIESFLKNNEETIGKITPEYSPLIDISIFPDELKKLPSDNSGVYMFFEKNNDELLYVGISTNLSGRIYDHIGKDFSWNGDSNKAHFPNVTLTSGKGWVDQKTRSIFENAEIDILTIGVSPPEAASLIESYIIFYGFQNDSKPKLNVNF